MKTDDNKYIQALSHLELLIPTDMLFVEENLWDRGLLRPVTQPVDNFRVVVDIDLKTQRETSIHLVLSSTGATAAYLKKRHRLVSEKGLCCQAVRAAGDGVHHHPSNKGHAHRQRTSKSRTRYVKTSVVAHQMSNFLSVVRIFKYRVAVDAAL